MFCGTDKEKASRLFEWRGLLDERRAQGELPTDQP